MRVKNLRFWSLGLDYLDEGKGGGIGGFVFDSFKWKILESGITS